MGFILMEHLDHEARIVLLSSRHCARSVEVASCRPLINLRPHLKRVAKGTVGVEPNPPIYKAPDSEEDFEMYE